MTFLICLVCLAIGLVIGVRAEKIRQGNLELQRGSKISQLMADNARQRNRIREYQLQIERLNEIEGIVNEPQESYELRDAMSGDVVAYAPKCNGLTSSVQPCPCESCKEQRTDSNEEILDNADKMARDRAQALTYRRLLQEGLVEERNGAVHVRQTPHFNAEQLATAFPALARRKSQPQVKRVWQGLLPELWDMVLRVIEVYRYLLFGPKKPEPKNDAVRDLQAKLDAIDAEIAKIGPPDPSVFRADNPVV